MLKSLVFIFIWIGFVADIFALGDINSGKTKSAVCAGCHGVDGNSIVPLFPKLAGQGHGYLFKQLQDFKSGARKDKTMTAMMGALTIADMHDIAAYYAAQVTTKGVSTVDAKIISLGGKIYKGGKKDEQVMACIACHGFTGKGIPSAKFPSLASQHAAYIVKQLKLFRQDSINAITGENLHSRSNDPDGVMIGFTKHLTNAEINAVAEYILGLH